MNDRLTIEELEKALRDDGDNQESFFYNHMIGVDYARQLLDTMRENERLKLFLIKSLSHTIQDEDFEEMDKIEKKDGGWRRLLISNKESDNG